MQQIEDYNNKKNRKLRIPRDKNNKKFRLSKLNDDQFLVAYVILDKIREWTNLAHATEEAKKKFKPLRLTVMGCGGTGKSVLITTVVSYIRKIFQRNNSVLVTAPTGAAAHNVGGQTIHREFKVNYKQEGSKLSNTAKKLLMEKQ